MDRQIGLLVTVQAQRFDLHWPHDGGLMDGRQDGSPCNCDFAGQGHLDAGYGKSNGWHWLAPYNWWYNISPGRLE
jgi:hypothetical protein